MKGDQKQKVGFFGFKKNNKEKVFEAYENKESKSKPELVK